MKRIFFFFIFVVALTGIILYSRGYRLDFTAKSITSTGILAVNSSPNAAKIYINGALKGVTNLNLTLPPGQYKIEVKKDGYSDWEKNITLRGEIVMSIDAVLFPNNPSLSPATNLGIMHAESVGESNRVLLFSANNNSEKDGIYIFESSSQPISFFPPLKLIILKKNLPEDIDFKNVDVTYSPDYSQAIFTFNQEARSYSYLLSLNDLNDQPLEITASKETLIEAWNVERAKQTNKILETFPKDIKKIATDSFHIVSFSPDETKILYVASNEATLPPVITPALIGANQTPESRHIEVGNLYIYDKKEDKNFLIVSPAPSPTLTQTKENTPLPLSSDFAHSFEWYSDSKHLIVKEEKQIVVLDYDGTNKRTIYSGPFEKDFFNVNDAGKLYVLTNLNPQNNTYGDLYEIGIR